MAEYNLKYPTGSDFLQAVLDHERRCHEAFNEWLPAAGIMAPKAMEALGTALSFLDRIATCWWGCEQGSHIEERLVGRTTSNARAALQLLKSGYYDESLGLVRQIGETANLASLLVQSEESYERWKGASEEVIRREFSPVSVRLRLEKLNLPLPMDQETYRLLSTQSVHVNPNTSPQRHNPYGLPMLGGYFQEAGALVSLNHLSGMVGWMLWLSTNLVMPPTDRQVIDAAAVKLLRSVGGVNLNSAQEYFGAVRESPQFRRASEQLRHWQTQRPAQQSSD